MAWSRRAGTSELIQQEDARAAVHARRPAAATRALAWPKTHRAGGHQRVDALGAGLARSRWAFSRARSESAVASRTMAITASTIGAATRDAGQRAERVPQAGARPGQHAGHDEDGRPGRRCAVPSRGSQRLLGQAEFQIRARRDTLVPQSGQEFGHGAVTGHLGTQAVPFIPLGGLIDRIDYLVVSGYKHLLSPRGTGYLYVRRDHWDELEPRNANWRAADLPYGRYFGGPLTLAPDARRFDVSRGWFAWIGATESLRLLAEWKTTGAFDAVRDMAKGLAARLGVPWYGGSLVCAQLDDGEAARAACLAAGVKASVRGTAVRFSVHVYNTEADLDRAAEAIAPFTGG